jgi:L-asparaginase
MRRVTLISTGGTIEKTYDESSGSLENRQTVVRQMLSSLRLEDTAVACVPLLSKDSLVLTDDDRELIVRAVSEAAAGMAPPDGVVVLHGTDTLCVTGALLHQRLAPALRVPVVLTGAMRPYEMKVSDALQNLTEAVFSSGVLPPGVYVAAHGRALRFPGPVKDRDRGTFVLSSAPSR